ncbi:MAG: hypothetical protein ACXQT5_07135 [Candidatus Syntropharchaeia archaeon]
MMKHHHPFDRDKTNKISNIFFSKRIGGNIGLMDMVFTLGVFSGAIISGAIPGYVLPFVLVGFSAILGIPILLMKPNLSK